MIGTNTHQSVVQMCLDELKAEWCEANVAQTCPACWSHSYSASASEAKQHICLSRVSYAGWSSRSLCIPAKIISTWTKWACGCMADIGQNATTSNWHKSVLSGKRQVALTDSIKGLTGNLFVLLFFTLTHSLTFSTSPSWSLSQLTCKSD